MRSAIFHLSLSVRKDTPHPTPQASADGDKVRNRALQILSLLPLFKGFSLVTRTFPTPCLVGWVGRRVGEES